MSKILVIEDEAKVYTFIKKGLEEEQFSVSLATDGKTGVYAAYNNDFDLILLDIMLPDADGRDVCKEIRENNKTVPILMLTALGTVEDKVLGLDSGADDYLQKPFSFKELVARVKALIRRTNALNNDEILKIANLELNLTTKTVKRSGIPIKLTVKEFQLLEYLLKNRNKVISRSELSSSIWDINFDTGTNTIDVYINYLRNKIDKNFEPRLIHTSVGMGYILKVD